mgnify:CR=1 FL=1
MRKRLIQLSLGLLIYPVAVPAQEAMVNISVESRPKSALIFVDREFKGKGNVTLQLPAGKHLLRVAGGEDYEPNQKEFFLQGGQPQTFVITLSPSARKWIQQGQALLAKGNYQEAQQLFHKSRNSLPVESFWWEGVAAMQACARIGATHSVVFGGFSAQSLRDRIEDTGAVAVLTADPASDSLQVDFIDQEGGNVGSANYKNG